METDKIYRIYVLLYLQGVSSFLNTIVEETVDEFGFVLSIEVIFLFGYKSLLDAEMKITT